MKFKEKNIHDLIEKLRDQYHIFIKNEFINYYLLNSNIPKNVWINIDDLFDSSKYYEAMGYDINKLYDQIFSFSSFISKIKKEILPRMQNEAAIRIRKMSENNKILYEMTLDNMPKNLRIFYDLVIELYINTKKVDKRLNGEENVLFIKLPYIHEIEKNLNT